MNETIIALTGYIAWTLLLLLGLAVYRSYLVLTHKPPIRFQHDGSDLTGFGNRLTRAFSNCIESFSFIGGLMLLALATDSQIITNPTAYWLLFARVCQSVIHLFSVSGIAIQLRFAFFLLQFAICVQWIWLFYLKFA